MNAEGGAMPCPFCGCAAEMMVRPAWRREPQTYFMACQSGFGSDEPLCAGEATYPYPTREQAIKAWNRRASTPSPEVQRVVDAARHLYNHGPCTVVTGPHKYDDAYAISKETMDPLFDAVEALAAREKA